MPSPLQNYLDKRRDIPRSLSSADYKAALKLIASEYYDAMDRLTGVQYSINTSGGLSARIPAHMNNQDLPKELSELLAESSIIKVVIQYRHPDGKEYVINQHNKEG